MKFTFATKYAIKSLMLLEKSSLLRLDENIINYHHDYVVTTWFKTTHQYFDDVMAREQIEAGLDRKWSVRGYEYKSLIPEGEIVQQGTKDDGQPFAYYHDHSGALKMGDEQNFLPIRYTELSRV